MKAWAAWIDPDDPDARLKPITLHEALSSRMALAGPTTKILTTLQAKVSDPGVKAKLVAMLAPQAKEQVKGWNPEGFFEALFVVKQGDDVRKIELSNFRQYYEAAARAE